jgi:hypothetical protein
MADKALLPIEAVRQLLDYEPDTGLLRWKPRGQPQWDATYAGKEALTGRVDGYKRGKLLEVSVRAHRVVWAWVYGYWPLNIDHINGDRTDNRLANLREVTVRQNAQNMKRYENNKSGYTGVIWMKRAERWRATIKILGRNKHLGSFRNIEDAIAARKQAEEALGFHPNHGRV